MADEILKHDNNRGKVAGAVTNDASQEIRQLRVDPTTGALLTASAGGGTSTPVEGDVAHDEVDEGNPVKIGGKAADPTSLPTAVTAGDRANLAISPNGELYVYLSRLTSGEDQANNVMKVEEQFSYANISTATTTTVKTGAGFIHEIRIIGGTALGDVTVYDSLSASGAVICPAVTPVANSVIIRDIKVSIGLTIVTAAATTITISYR